MMKGNFLRYFLVMMIAILASSACYAQTNQGYSKKKTVTTKTVSRSRSSKKHKYGSNQSYSAKTTSDQYYDKPIFDMRDISKKIENQHFIVFLVRNGSVYGFNKNTHKYFSIMAEVADIGFKDSSKSILSIKSKDGKRYFYNLFSGKSEMEVILGMKLSDLSYHTEFKRQVDALHQFVLSYYNGNPNNLSKEEVDACINRYNYCYKIITDFESAFNFYYSSNSSGITANEAKNRLISAKNAGHQDAIRIYNELF